jgi:hypothetical protein
VRPKNILGQKSRLRFGRRVLAEIELERYVTHKKKTEKEAKKHGNLLVPNRIFERPKVAVI